MKVSFKNPNPGTWFEMEGGGEVCIRLVNHASLREIRKECIKSKVEYKKGFGRITYEDFDEEKFSHQLWQNGIVDWKGIYDADTGEEIPCTDENKVYLCANSVQFLAFFTEKLEELRETNKIETEEEEKN